MPAKQRMRNVIARSLAYVGNYVGNLTGNVTGDVTGNVTGNLAGNVSGGSSANRRTSQALTASGAITAKQYGLVTLAHATVVIAATLAAPTAGDDIVIVNTSASGTAAHTVTLPSGVTWDGTNNTATLDAPEESLHAVAVSATRWKIIQNIGSVGLSTV